MQVALLNHSVRTMLALPVERLLSTGSSNTSEDNRPPSLHGDMSMSPDSNCSDISIDSSNNNNNMEKGPESNVRPHSENKGSPATSESESCEKNLMVEIKQEVEEKSQQQEPPSKKIKMDTKAELNNNNSLMQTALRANGVHKSFTTTARFSISDILRPDFGKIAILQSHEGEFMMGQRRRKSQISECSMESNRRPSRPNSVKNHSEDSNSSTGTTTSTSTRGGNAEVVDESKVNPPVPQGPLLWPAWVYCTRYSDRPSSGPRSRRIRTTKEKKECEEKRPRTAFTTEQLSRLKKEFEENRYLTEKRRQDLARELQLHENQIKIWFQNKRAKLKKSSGARNDLALQLMAQGLYNHSTVPMDEDEEFLAMQQQLQQQQQQK